jgi:mannose-1-phosphate guanylyltransferase/phosphomannomutase
VKAVILCAGKGTRIREVTGGNIPKPMIEVEGKPILEYTLENLREQGVDEVLINLHHKGSVIEEYFGPDYCGLNIKYFWEEKLRGTSGSLAQMSNDIEDDFLVVYGDIVTDLNYGEFRSFHQAREGIGTVLTYSGEENLTEASILQLEEDKISSFVEKPSESKIKSLTRKGLTWTNAGVYCLDPEVFEFIAEEGQQDFGHDVLPEILQSKYDLNGYKIPDNIYWREVGKPSDYENLIQDVSKGKLEWI